MPVADRHLWYTRDRASVVESGDLAARFLFAPTGTMVSPEDMARLGLEERDGKIVIHTAVGTTAVLDGGASATDSRPAADDSPVLVPKKRGRPKKSAVAE